MVTFLILARNRYVPVPVQSGSEGLNVAVWLVTPVRQGTNDDEPGCSTWTSNAKPAGGPADAQVTWAVSTAPTTGVTVIGTFTVPLAAVSNGSS